MKLDALAWLLCAYTALPCAAQTGAPSTEQMIERLKVPRTRSLRNITVEPATAQGHPSTSQDSPEPSLAASSNQTGETPSAPTVSVDSASPPVRPSLSLLIQFDFNSARVRPESQEALANLSQALLSPELMGSKFVVEGHTDGKGSADYNQQLSEHRAQSVRDFLKGKGVDEYRLMATGKGATELANRAEPFAAENRRVRIVNLE